ncbi:MAG: aldehyde dehydrogenase family protein [Gammaproteobacteria bacterium]
MEAKSQFYINGQWVEPTNPGNLLDVINPATEQPITQISLGDAADVDKAAQAARAAFPAFSTTSREERLELLQAILAEYQKRLGSIAEAISAEMGAPKQLANAAQAPSGMAHFMNVIEVLKNYSFTAVQNGTAIVHEPVGVCGLITPWNWPINQISCKVAPALAAGCTMVLKPSEVAPLDAMILAEILHEAGVPAGVFNLVNGDGPVVGEAIAAHPDIDMVSFTGSTRAGVRVATLAAESVKRVAQELGGKSANVILEDADLESAVVAGARHCFNNSGQSCNAPTRMLVPRNKHQQAAQIAAKVAEKITVGDPTSEKTQMGPVSSGLQYDRIQTMIQKGIDEGAELVTGGIGKPSGLNQGYYVKPTVFANVSNDMAIARQEIFGPVLSILPYDNEEEAITIANDTEYGLSGYVSSGDLEHARNVAAQLRAGNVHINNASADFAAPFGGYKKSGNGREWGSHGFAEFLETKAVMGYESK